MIVGWALPTLQAVEEGFFLKLGMKVEPFNGNTGI